jgi:hypothetical protein
VADYAIEIRALVDTNALTTEDARYALLAKIREVLDGIGVKVDRIASASPHVVPDPLTAPDEDAY